MRRRRPPKRSQNNEEFEFLYQDELTDSEIAECVPNGKLSIQCFICGEQMSKIYKLREHIKLHELAESYDEGTLEAAPIYEILNPQKLNIETPIIRDFVMGEVKAKRYSQFYGILTEADVELHISDSETDDDDADADGDRDKNFEIETDTKYISNTYKCDLCNLVFDRRYKAIFHQKTEHSKNNLLFKCDYCEQRFIGVQLLIHHLRNQCESDEYPISCVERFQQHLIKVNVEQFQCLDEARNLLKTRRFTTAEKCFSCKECDKTFLRAEHLNRHMETVHLPDERKLECLVCFKKFNRKDNLRSHMKVHLKEAAEHDDDNSNNQAILCQICGHCFTSKSNYVVHMRRHTGEKPYTCDVCGKGFPKSTDLNSHKTKHSGERNFICKICNRAFARAAVLSKHMRVHEGPYSCNYCNCSESFKRPNELANHLRNHAACLTYICNICKSQFANREELEAHCETCVQNNSSDAAPPKSKNKRTKKEKATKKSKKGAKALTESKTSSTNESVSAALTQAANLSSTDIENTNTVIKTEQKATAGTEKQ